MAKLCAIKLAYNRVVLVSPEKVGPLLTILANAVIVEREWSGGNNYESVIREENFEIELGEFNPISRENYEVIRRAAEEEAAKATLLDTPDAE